MVYCSGFYFLRTVPRDAQAVWLVNNGIKNGITSVEYLQMNMNSQE